MGDIENSVLSCSGEESQKVSKGSSGKDFFYFREMIFEGVDEYEGARHEVRKPADVDAINICFLLSSSLENKHLAPNWACDSYQDYFANIASC